MTEPTPPDRRSPRVPPEPAATGGEHVPRPDVVEVDDDTLSAPGATGTEGHRPDHLTSRTVPRRAPGAPDAGPSPAAQDEPARWRRPPGRTDDRGEPTGPS
jgi:hypothetical protein